MNKQESQTMKSLVCQFKLERKREGGEEGRRKKGGEGEGRRNRGKHLEVQQWGMLK